MNFLNTPVAEMMPSLQEADFMSLEEMAKRQGFRSYQDMIDSLQPPKIASGAGTVKGLFQGSSSGQGTLMGAVQKIGPLLKMIGM